MNLQVFDKKQMSGRQHFLTQCVVRVGLACVLLTISTNSYANEDQPGSNFDEQRDIGQLIQQLGETSFEARERAANQLVEFGAAAESALSSQLKNPDPEIQFRCRYILERIAVNKFEQRLVGFLAENGEKGDHQLPGWERFQKAYGTAKPAKELFVSMLRAEPDLIKALEDNRQEVVGILSQRVTDQQQKMRFQQMTTLPTVATMLFLAGDEDVDVGQPAAQLITSFCYQPSFREGIAEGSPTREILQVMLERWLVRDNPVVMQQGMILSLQYDLPVGLKLAKRILQDDGGAKHMQMYALLALAKLGKKDDAELLDLLKSKFEDKTLLSTTKINDQSIQTQARDIALVALLHLQELDLKKFGFENAQEQAMMLYAPHTLGFENDEKRAVAFEKWKTFSEKDPK